MVVVELGALVVVVAFEVEVGVGAWVVIGLELGVACLAKKLTAAASSNSKKQHHHLYTIN